MESLTDQEKETLLELARGAMERAVRGEAPELPDLNSLPERLRQPGCTFVTLTRQGLLRGCIGALEAHDPLALDVCEHAVAAALQDYRFPPVIPADLPEIEIEVSRLTDPQPLEYIDAADLLVKLRPGLDGVTLRDGWRRATFLPQVWEKVSDPVMFLSHLCDKLGGPPDLWRRKKLDVSVYQVEEFHENRKPDTPPTPD